MSLERWPSIGDQDSCTYLSCEQAHGRLETYTANLALARGCQVHRHGQTAVQGVFDNGILGNG